MDERKKIISFLFFFTTYDMSLIPKVKVWNINLHKRILQYNLPIPDQIFSPQLLPCPDVALSNTSWPTQNTTIVAKNAEDASVVQCITAQLLC